MNIDFDKYPDGLAPAIVQDNCTMEVLMLGYMNREALEQTLEQGKVTFFSRSKKRLWTKGETSGHWLLVQSVAEDCDQDAILIQAQPLGPTCHTGARSCFGQKPAAAAKGFLYRLQDHIAQRIESDDEHSYTKRLFQKGMNKIAQKVGEEAVELVIEAKDDNDDLFKNEAADLLYHFLVLLRAKNMRLEDVEAVLCDRADKTAR